MENNNVFRVLIFNDDSRLNHSIVELVRLSNSSYEFLSSTIQGEIMNAIPESGKCIIITDAGFYIGNSNNHKKFIKNFLAEVRRKNSECKIILLSAGNLEIQEDMFDYFIPAGKENDVEQLFNILSEYLR